MNPAEIKWIKELDGLRAIAVMLVLLFHAQLEIFMGGGVGVDIFFVISGFIITLKLLNDSRSGNINLIEFWQTRFARLVPAMLAVSIFIFLCSPLVFAGSSLERIYYAAISSLVYGSNFFFMAEAGYFDTSSLAKPMLHTWSLAVEEQFYLVWPILIIALVKLPARFWLWGLGAIAALSVAFAVWTDAINPSIAFYMMPARIYQFCAGAMIAVAAINLRGIAGNIAFGVGLAGLFAVAVLVDPAADGLASSHFLPTALTALVIAAIRSPLSTALLATAPATFIGRISYSVYLAHWPLMVFYFNQNAFELPDWIAAPGLILISVGAGYLMHRFIENRFRFHQGSDERRRRNVLWVAATSSALTLGAAALVAPQLRPVQPVSVASVQEEAANSESVVQNMMHFDAGLLKEDMHARALYGECSFVYGGPFRVDIGRMEGCVRSLPDRTNVLVWGSSISDAPFVALTAALSSTEFHVAKAGLAGCDPHLDPLAYTHLPENTPTCRQFVQEVRRLLEVERFDVVVLAGTWRTTDRADLPELIRYIRSTGAEPILFGSTPLFQEDVPVTIQALSFEERASLNLNTVMLDNFRNDVSEIHRVAQSENVRFVSGINFLCRPTHCPAFDRNGNLLYYDRFHPTFMGSISLRDILVSSVYDALAENER
jgi:peptidoglycan/LPS O-acetylase OafA/YrhL